MKKSHVFRRILLCSLCCSISFFTRNLNKIPHYEFVNNSREIEVRLAFEKLLKCISKKKIIKQVQEWFTQLSYAIANDHDPWYVIWTKLRNKFYLVCTCRSNKKLWNNKYNKRKNGKNTINKSKLLFCEKSYKSIYITFVQSTA